jgi:hypothetical protein
MAFGLIGPDAFVGHPQLAADPWYERAWMSVQLAWGTAPLNRWFDGAGPYRRVAMGAAALAIPSFVQAGTMIRHVDHRVCAVLHLVVGVSYLWSARDMVRTEAFGRVAGFPHPSIVVLLASILAKRSIHPDGLDVQITSPVLVAGAGLMAAAVLLECLPHGHGNRFRALISRAIIIVGAAMVGVAWTVLGWAGFGAAPVYSIAMLVMGLIAVTLAVSEYRLVSRAIALLLR